LLIALAVASMLAHAMPVSSGQAPHPPDCRLDGEIVKVSALQEASGVAVSRQHPGRAWSHNDSGKPVLVALNQRGAVTGQIELTGVSLEDWEALAVGPCPAGSCLYIGDIGDNDGRRKRITVYRLPEPDPRSKTAAVQDAFHATYPDGAHDAETLLVTAKGDIFIVTKGDPGPVAVYRFPPDSKSGATVALEQVGNPRDAGGAGADDRITDGALSPRGQWVALRTNHDVRFHAAADLLTGHWRQVGRVDLKPLGEPQGEGIAFADDASLYLVGEGGGIGQPGTFTRLTCTFDESSGR
jgi:hypothetical protein